MRLNPANFEVNLQARQSEPRYVVSIEFAAGDVYYFTSHQDCALPNGAVAITSVVKRPSGVTQRLRAVDYHSEIGEITLDLVDRGNLVTALIKSKLDSGRGLKGKKLRVYCGYKTLAWSDYQVVATQIVRQANYHNGLYKFRCADIQRALREKIFATVEMKLGTTVEAGDTTIPVTFANLDDQNNLQMVAHGASYSDAPNQTVGYVLIESEIIRYTGKTSNSLTGCTRGALNTLAVPHRVDTASGDRPMPVKEYIYIEMPAVKLALAVMTGALYGQGGATLPTGWHLGIDAQWIRQSDFTSIGVDWWDPANDAEGVIVRFEGLVSQDGQRFIEQQLFLLLGAYPLIYSDGTLGIKRATRVMYSAAPIATLGVRDIVEYSELEHDMASVINWIEINWNYDALQKRTTRTTTLLDTDSIGKHGMGQRKVVQMLGWHGGKHAEGVLKAQFDSLRDRFAGPPQKMRIKALHKWSGLEVGDIIRLQLAGVMDWVTGQALDRSFEIQSVQTDWITGEVSLELFGSTEQASASILSTTTVLPDSAYSALGGNLASLPTITSSGGVGHVTANTTLEGAASTAGGAGRYYYLGDLTIDAGVVLTITQNVQLWVMGHLTINGHVNGVGQGLAGGVAVDLYPNLQYMNGVPGVPGWIGTTMSTGGFYRLFKPGNRSSLKTIAGQIGVGKNAEIPRLTQLKWTGGQLVGLPPDARGTSGGSGAMALNYHETDFALGGDGGNGGASLITVSRGLDFGVAGTIDLSGNDGEPGALSSNGWMYSGSGAGGYAGAYIAVLDGNQQYPGGIESAIISRLGDCPIPLGGYEHSDSDANNITRGAYAHPGYAGRAVDAYSVEYIPDVEYATPDINTEVVQPPTGLILESHEPHLLTNQDGTQTPRLYFQFSASPDPYLSGYQLQYRLDTDTLWTSISALLSVDELHYRATGVKEGQVVWGRVRAVNKWNKASAWSTYGPHTVVGKSSLPSNVEIFTAAPLPDGVDLTWSRVADADLLEYEMREGESWGVSVLVARVRATSFKLPPLAAGHRRWMIKAIDTGGRYSAVEQVVTLAVAGPAAVNVSAAIEGAQAVLTWSAPASLFAIVSYEIRVGASWGTGSTVAVATGTSHQLPINWGGAQTFWVAANDAASNVGAAGSVTLSVSAPAAPAVNYVIDGTDAVLTWGEVSSVLPLAGYEVRHGASWAAGTYVTRQTGLSLRLPVSWGGGRTFWVSAIDAVGNVGVAGASIVTITAPSTVPVTAEVIDNNVMLRLGDVVSTLPVRSYEVRRGSTWEGGTILGTVAAKFFVRFEGAAGVYTYWAAAIDAAVNYGAPGQVTANVAQPPDYVLVTDVRSSFGGAASNMVQDADGSWVLPVNATQTFEQHFTASGWTSPQDQVNAGYSLFAQPAAASGYYEETYDYGAVIASTKITVTVGGAVVSGAPVVSVTISVSANGTVWTDYVGVTEAFALNFRYVKYRVTVTGSGGDDLYRITAINLKLDKKSKGDAGMVTCNAADSGGTQVLFNVPFVDVSSITVTPQGTTPVISIFDFVDAPNPTGFKVLLFNQSGARVSGPASWSVKGF